MAVRVARTRRDPAAAFVLRGSAEMSDSASIEITVNGAARQVPEGTTVADLIALSGLGGKRVAVERNRDVVPRARHAELVLEAGDRLELVTFVGGG